MFEATIGSFIMATPALTPDDTHYNIVYFIQVFNFVLDVFYEKMRINWDV